VRLRSLLFLSLLPCSAALAGPLEKGDASAGKPLHDKSCIACHVKLHGGDGSKMYTRSPRLINTPEALVQRVAACNAQTNTGWFPEEEVHVASYLNQQYYKFK
jgi:mono/diheme cytochrome c family protein